MFSCCVVFAAMEVTAGLITCICFPECPSMKKQFGQWNVIRIAGTRYVRFCALSVQMMADMSALSSKIDAYSHRLSYFELSEVLRMLRQNVQPVDYEPLILSPNRNLRMLGLSVVWRFGIEDAEEILLRIVAENRSEESVGAMYVLCTLHSVITRPEVEKFVGGMNPVQRRVLLRYIARQGYSANALQVFIPEEEKRYYVSLVDSYKLNVG